VVVKAVLLEDILDLKMEFLLKDSVQETKQKHPTDISLNVEENKHG
jgi:hypothetical protein